MAPNNDTSSYHDGYYNSYYDDYNNSYYDYYYNSYYGDYFNSYYDDYYNSYYDDYNNSYYDDDYYNSYYDDDYNNYNSLQRLMFRAYKAYSIFIIVVILLGIVGNAVSFTVIIYRGLARTSAIYFCLVCIAFLDLMFNLMAGLLGYIAPTLAADEFMSHLYYEWKYALYNYESSREKPRNIGDVMCNLVTYVSSGAAVASVWMNVIVHATKLVGQLSPFGKLSQNIKPITISCCVISVVFGFAVWVPMITGYKIEVDGLDVKFIDPEDTDGGVFQIHRCTPFLYGLLAIDSVYYTSLTTSITYSMVPGALLILLSLTIVGVFLKNYREHRRLMSAQTDTGTRKKQRDNFQMAKNRVLMLLPLSFMHIACTIPVIVMERIREARFQSGLGKGITDDQLTPDLLVEFMLERLRDINHSVTFFIQLALSKSFRQDLFGK